MPYERKKLKFGEFEVEAWHTSDTVNGYEYSIEIEPPSPNGNYKQFHLMKLSGISIKEIPNSCHIVFENPKSEFKRVDYVKIKSKNGRHVLDIILFIGYNDWEMKESVASFVDRFCDAVKKSIRCAVNPVKTEMGYFLHCQFDISSANDIYKYYSEKESHLERVFRENLTHHSVEVVSEKYGEDRLHWWIRYVIVPLAGGGAIATVLGKYLLI